ncbi:transposase family protein [Streptomyces albus]|uniref:Transposase n=2 Tax=Streptomyces albus TaxID=1888 RepID=A0A6C1BUP1_9ACTN|nr:MULTISPECIES: DDE-type integrase/transposase/recombinase [Streptomyces]QID34273.1 transposase family protein [Streptomyces albus]TGG80845.1 transposase [Streptomyces albus]UVN53080.1 DDE-type integrase/transposase/recombinase [Streptomyces albus]UVN58851.1 DDE-type integrase/transposase/recombinase [Streptomyces albus]GHJ19103.1 transposase [Streptomyces albus]
MTTVATQPPVMRHARRGVLAPGDGVQWHGGRYTVTALSGVTVHLAPQAGSPQPPAAVLLAALAAAEDFAVLNGAGRPVPHTVMPDWALLEGISEEAAREARIWERHVIEVDTGLLPGVPEGSLPREGYDPRCTTLIQRYQAKAAELSAVLGWKMSWQTVQTKRLKYKAEGAWGLVDKRRTRSTTLYGRTDIRVVDLLLELVEAGRGAVPGNAMKLFTQLRRAARARYGAGVKVPADSTLYKLLERLGIDARRPQAPRGRHARAAGRPAPPFTVTSAIAPGEVVQIDSTDLDVKVLGDDGLPASVELTAAVDVATRSIIAAVVRPKTPRRRRRGAQARPGLISAQRSTGRATKAVDASLLLAQALVPAPMRPGFSPLAHASASHLPYDELAAADERFAQAAGRPVIVPDLIVIDHGTVFAGRTFFDACAYLGISVRPARRRTPTDKAIVERTFASVKSMFSQWVNTYTGHDFTRRAAAVDGQRLWTLAQLDDLLQEWIALGWQNHPHEELRSPYDPNLPALTPNQMYAACVQAAGYLPIPLGEEDYLRLLPTAWVGVTDQGIRFKNRTYENPSTDPDEGLNPYRYRASGLRGKKRGGWELRYNPYTPERVWLRDHQRDRWVEATFVHQHLIGAPWTQYLWDVACAEHVERGGGSKDEEAIAQALAELLERAGHGPQEPGAVTVPDGYGPALLPAPAPAPFDPYAGAAPVDLTGLEPLGSLELDDLGMYTAAPLPAPPAGEGPAAMRWEEPGASHAPPPPAGAGSVGGGADLAAAGGGQDFTDWYWKGLPAITPLPPLDDDGDSPPPRGPI